MNPSNPMSPVTAAPADPAEWISLRAASRLLGGLDPSTTKSLALAHRIRVAGLPGARLRYSREDVLRLLAQR